MNFGFIDLISLFFIPRRRYDDVDADDDRKSQRKSHDKYSKRGADMASHGLVDDYETSSSEEEHDRTR